MTFLSPYSWSNVKTKVVLTACFVGGLFCSIYSAFSCSWYTFTPADNPYHDYYFLPEDTSTVNSIGLFRYQLKVEGVDPWHVPCKQYEPLFLSKNAWYFVPQLVVPTTLLMIAGAWLFGLTGNNQCAITFALLFTLLAHVVAIILSVGWCDEVKTCVYSVLVGLSINLLALVFYITAFAIAGCVLKPKTEEEEDEEDSCYNSTNAHDASSLSKISLDDVPIDVSESSTDEESANRVLSAEELLGTNDAVTINAVRLNALLMGQVKSFVRKMPRRQEDNDTNDFADDEASEGCKSWQDEPRMS
jgi:hypothetical protein